MTRFTVNMAGLLLCLNSLCLHADSLINQQQEMRRDIDAILNVLQSGVSMSCSVISDQTAKHVSTHLEVSCPSGTFVTGGGAEILAHKGGGQEAANSSITENSFPKNNGWVCNKGFGLGHYRCYAICCASSFNTPLSLTHKK